MVLLPVAAAGVRWRGSRLPRALVQVAAVAALGLAVVNADAQILRHNTTTDLDAPVDIGYLKGLSADAVPATTSLREPLRSCLLAAHDQVSPARGASWNLGRSRGAQVLADKIWVVSPEQVPC